MLKIKILDANTHSNLCSGYGAISSNIASGLINLGHDVYYDLITDCEDPVLNRLAHKQFTDTPDVIFLWIRPPHYIKYSQFDASRKNIFYTMHEKNNFEGWKSDWPELLNKCTAVITSTEWNKGVFIKAGVTVPVHVVPVGVNTNIFRTSKDNKFGILAVHDALGSVNSREMWQDTILAFTELFKSRPLAYLTVKSWNIKFQDYNKFLLDNRIRPDDADVRIVDQVIPLSSMAEFYRNHDLFVKNSNLEGWSIPLTEALACGLPAVIYDNPVLRENAGPESEDNIIYFKKRDQLKFWMDHFYHKWQKKVRNTDKYSWRYPVKKLEEILLSYAGK